MDAREVTRAVSNLVVNAIRHTPAGGTVRVEVTRSDGWSSVHVADECGGIPADQLPHLFEPGWRASQARGVGDGAGAGLGLAIAKAVADAHRGTLAVHNTAAGCDFELRLPERA